MLHNQDRRYLSSRQIPDSLREAGPVERVNIKREDSGNTDNRARCFEMFLVTYNLWNVSLCFKRGNRDVVVTIKCQCELTLLSIYTVAVFFLFDMFYLIYLYIPTCPLDIFASLKPRKVDFQAHELQRATPFLASVSSTAGIAPQVHSDGRLSQAQLSQGDGWVWLLHVSNPQCALLSSILPSILSQWHWFLGRRIGYCWSERPWNLPKNVHQCCPLPIFYLFPVSRILQWREVSQQSGGCVWSTWL